MKKFLYLITTAIFLTACGGGSNENSSSKYPPVNKKIVINNNNEQIETINKAGNANIKLSLQSHKDVYITINSHFNQNIKINSSYASNENRSYRVVENKRFLKEPFKVIEFRESLKNYKKTKLSLNARVISTNKRAVNQNDTENFYAEVFNKNPNGDTVTIRATARKVVKDVQTKYGKKNLVIWVADDDYNDGSLFSRGDITQEMVDNLADIFLKDGENNDIYDWETNIYGPEWGADARNYDSNLIANSDYIDILIYDMKNNNMAGFFYAKDNFTRNKEPKSNEKIMFYINSKLYANNPEEVFTTLVHEFQHMINFYQRWVKKDIVDPTWFNEMMSETTEDLLATKIKYDGPRNVDYHDGSAGAPGNREGRYPYFNRYNYYPVNQWFGDIDDYARASAFGAFLIRNYGGAEFLHNLIYSSYSGEEAIVKATGQKDFNTILNKWSQAVMLSDKTDLEDGMPQYNFGDFKYSSYNDITYEMGSINFFNYIPKPYFQSSNFINKNGILYYKVGENLVGNIEINIKMDGGGDINIIAK